MPVTVPLLYALLMVLVLAGAAVAAPDDRTLAKAARGVTTIVAHRGSSADCPENSLAAYERAIAAGAHAIEADLRLTSDGHLVSMHDATLDRTTNGSGAVDQTTLAAIRKLDAGSWFHERFRGERVPTFEEILALAKDRVDVFLDLKDSSGLYEQRVVEAVRRWGKPAQIVLGVRSIRASQFYKANLPDLRQVALMPAVTDTAGFLAEGVRVIRLWPRWLGSSGALELLRGGKAELLLSAGDGSLAETTPVLAANPEWLFTDDPARLQKTLQLLRQSSREEDKSGAEN